MGIFSKNSSVNEVDAGLAAVILAYSDKAHTQTLKLLAESQDIIRKTLDSGESPVCAFWHLGGLGGNMLLLVTSKRTLSLKKNSIKQELWHKEVAETKIGKFPNGSPLVQIISLKSQLDYKESDNRRFQWIIQFTVDTPRAAQAICAAVNQFLPEK